MTEAATDVRRVRITVLAIAYSHIHVAELVLGGTPPRQAFDWAWRVYYEYVAPRAWLTFCPGQPLTSFATTGLHPDGLAQHGTSWIAPIPEGKRWTQGCFAVAAQQNRDYLRSGEPDGTTQPAALMDAADADRLAWMLEMMRRYSTGAGELADCARGAVDQAAGKPRQRRAPADEAWLRDEVSDALSGTWAILRREAATRASARLARMWPTTRPHRAQVAATLLAQQRSHLTRQQQARQRRR